MGLDSQSSVDRGQVGSVSGFSRAERHYFTFSTFHFVFWSVSAQKTIKALVLTLGVPESIERAEMSQRSTVTHL
jgi:hypothetical protein